MSRATADTLLSGEEVNVAQQSAGRDGVPSKQERIEFLKEALAFTEWNIRSFDTKAQISIAAFVLSMSPLWSIIISADPRAASSIVVAGLLLLFLITVLLYGFVIWPITLKQSKLTGAWEAQGLFFVRDPSRLTTRLYAERLKTLAIETELTAETLRLAAIRQTKSRRFKRALVATFIFYVGFAVSFFLLRNCAVSGSIWACTY